ncbi:AI-2E family transporter [Flaviflagellibacter deserti]|uniref:AI-2E family transporter n=1 Tax=Flaviflagellibacter deserti TaxID=2267266 RepID=A0ABV9Z3I3_9HYPH
MTIQRQVIFWLVAFVLVVFVLWLLSDILLPFVAGFALAYMLDPLADRLSRTGIGRTTSAVLILLAFLLVVIVLGAILVPMLVDQLQAFVNNLPDYISRIQALIAGPGLGWLRSIAGDRLPSVQSSIGGIVSQGASWAGDFLKSLLQGGAALMSVASLLVVTPVVAFYMLVDWDRMTGSIDGWVPVRHRDTVRQLAREMNDAVAGFVRGQSIVCILLGTMYGVGLTVVGLNFGLLIGLGAGLISFVPYVGSLTGLVVATGVALVQFWPDYVSIGLVLLVFAVGQFIEGNILSPNLVGRSVGLHPVWLMFALFAFGALFGFVGLLLAVPLAAAAGVIVRFALSQYLASEFYTGGEAAKPKQPRRKASTGKA